MRVIFVALSVAFGLFGQTADLALPAGAGLTRATLHLPRPIRPGDEIVIFTSTTKLTPVVISPSGQRFTKATAESLGAAWRGRDITPPAGMAENGESIILEFEREATSGDWVMEVPLGIPNLQSRVSMRFVSGADVRDAFLSRMPGYQKSGPVTLSKAGTLDLQLDQDDEGVLFDIAVSDVNAKVTLTAPDGTEYSPTTAVQGVEWKKFASRAPIDAPGSMFGAAGMLLSEDGPHHLVGFDKASKGVYRITVTPVSGTVQVSAAIIPFGRMFKDEVSPAAATSRR